MKEVVEVLKTQEEVLKDVILKINKYYLHNALRADKPDVISNAEMRSGLLLVKTEKERSEEDRYKAFRFLALEYPENKVVGEINGVEITMKKVSKKNNKI